MSLRSKLRPYAALALPVVIGGSICDRMLGRPIANWESHLPQGAVKASVVIGVLALASLVVWTTTGKEAEAADEVRRSTRPDHTPKGRQVWFDSRDGFTRIVHWKGLAVVVGGLLASFAGMAAMVLLGERTSQGVRLVVGVPVIVAPFLWSLWMTDRHSARR